MVRLVRWFLRLVFRRKEPVQPCKLMQDCYGRLVQANRPPRFYKFDRWNLIYRDQNQRRKLRRILKERMGS